MYLIDLQQFVMASAERGQDAGQFVSGCRIMTE